MAEMVEMELLRHLTVGRVQYPPGAKVQIPSHKVNRLIDAGIAKKVTTEEPYRATRRQRVTTEDTDN